MARKLVWIVLGIVLIGSVALYPKVKQMRVEVPEYQKPGELVLLDQGWTEEQRRQFHHTPQGTQLVPYSWFLALDQPCLTRCEPLHNSEYLARFGFLESPKDDALNPDGLPVGLAREEGFVNPTNGKTYPVLGLTCAACHTGELRYDKYSVRIEGGVAMLQPTMFQKALGVSLILTSKLPWKFSKFADNVLGEKASDEARAELKASLQAFVANAEKEVELTQARSIYPNDAGFARTDALTRIGNQVFGSDMSNPENYAQANAPVRFPQVWDASWFTWVQYNSSIADPLVRNIGEALGVRALAQLSGPQARVFPSSVNMRGLKKLEDLLSGEQAGTGLRSPKWPSVLPALDTAKVAAGEKLYTQHCAGCHLPPMQQLLEDRNQATSQYWLAGAGGKKYLDLRDVSIDYVGTDPRQALDFMARSAETGVLGKGRVSAGEGLELVTKGIRDQFFQRAGLTDAQQLEWSGFRSPQAAAVRSEKIYKARPLNGVWATAPYLHNGSVPNLYALIASREQRGKPEFWLGTRQYDPKDVGYVPAKLSGATKFNYDLPGNSNEGHWFENGPRGRGVVGPALTDDQRRAIVEYLKSL